MYRIAFKLRLIDWLLGLNARAAIFQLYSGNDNEMDDKIQMNSKWVIKMTGPYGNQYWHILEGLLHALCVIVLLRKIVHISLVIGPRLAIWLIEDE